VTEYRQVLLRWFYAEVLKRAFGRWFVTGVYEGSWPRVLSVNRRRRTIANLRHEPLSEPTSQNRYGRTSAREPSVVVLLCAAVAAGAQAQELPAGAGRDVVTTRCLSCHEADLIMQQRLSRAAWTRSLDKMVKWGAVIETSEREPMLDYLAAHFAPRPPASHIVATAASEVIYKRACLTCHEDDVIESQRLSRAGWIREVDKMIRWGAAVTATEKDALVDYLAARYPPR